MAIALNLDPAWSAQVTTAAVTSASFSPGNNELIILEFQEDFATADTLGTLTPSNSGTALTWNAIGTAQRGVSNQAVVMAWWAFNTTAQVGITATVTAGTGTTNRAKCVKISTFTGAARTSAVDSLAAGSSSTNNLTVNVNTTATDVRVMGSAVDFLSLGVPTSTDDETGYDTTDSSGVSVRKSANTAVSGTSVALNFDAGGAGTPAWAYKIWQIRPYYSGTSALGLTLGLASTGSRKSQGTSALGLTMGLTAAGRRGPKGSTALAMTVAIAATGRAKAQGTANLSMTMGLFSHGDDTDTKGQAALGLSVEITVTGVALSRIIPVRILTPQEIMVGNRNTRYYLDILDNTDAPLYRLNGVTDGELDWIANASIKGGGKLTVVDVDQGIDWLTARIKPWMQIEGLPPQPLGIFLPSETPEQWGNGRKWNIKLLDNLTILDRDTITETYGLAAGTVVTPEIVALIESAGVTNHAITASAKTLDFDMAWSVGTSKLRIVNDLLDLIGYFSLFSNFEGQYVGAPYTLPAQRPIIYEFFDGPESIYEPDFTRDIDIQGIPNRVTLIGIGDGTTEALDSTAENNDPNSPYSIPRRGVIAITETGIEAADQASLDLLARKRLSELTTPTSGVEIAHSPVPGLTVNQASQFRRVPAGIDARHVVSRTALTLDGKALAKTTLREVVEV